MHFNWKYRLRSKFWERCASIGTMSPISVDQNVGIFAWNCIENFQINQTTEIDWYKIVLRQCFSRWRHENNLVSDHLPKFHRDRTSFCRDMAEHSLWFVILKRFFWHNSGTVSPTDILVENGWKYVEYEDVRGRITEKNEGQVGVRSWQSMTYLCRG